MTRIRRLLIANRGEIACRVIRTARAMGMCTVAVYSDADEMAVHVKAADEAVHIGPSAATESYLAIPRIIAAARESNSDAIHPGYGFLSENPDFARGCENAGIVFVGPAAHAIELMGDKARAKRAMIDAGVPCIPGYQGDDQTLETLMAEARRIGFPLMIKAAAGGGGRGMRLVEDADALTSGLDTARSEAMNAFGCDDLILEKALVNARHVEVQVFGDRHRNIVHLGERDCSVQRRHQKVIEEAPCPAMTLELREAMGQAAVSAARAVDYVGAGTVEFLLAEDGGFYFLEMNARLQVEHPVTECITGLDLVELQLKVAEGEPLGLARADVRLSGHAIEVRLYAEDARNGFLPSTGVVRRWREPCGQDVRVDAGVEDGSEVSSFYDPMLAKVIASGQTREEARVKLVKALAGSALFGPATNRDFLIDALTRDAFVSGQATTAFIGQNYGEAGFRLAPGLDELAMAAVARSRCHAQAAVQASLGVNTELLDWSSGVPLESVCTFAHDDTQVSLTVRALGRSRYRVTDGAALDAEYEVLAFDAETLKLKSGGETHDLIYFESHDELTLATHRLEFTVRDASVGRAADDAARKGAVVSPMHGQLLEIYVEPGETVSKGQRLALIEAMKMQQEIRAESDGTVLAVHAKRGTQIALNDLLIELEAA